MRASCSGSTATTGRCRDPTADNRVGSAVAVAAAAGHRAAGTHTLRCHAQHPSATMCLDCTTLANWICKPGLCRGPEPSPPASVSARSPDLTTRTQKISGRLRSEQAVRYQCAICGYISTAAKERHQRFTALRAALTGNAWMPASPGRRLNSARRPSHGATQTDVTHKQS